jgi:glycosyltransferase involved in cell wall biosynthesis
MLGVLPKLVKDGFYGFVVRVADTNGLVEKIHILTIDKRLREGVTLRTKEYAKEFGIDMTVKRFIAALNSLSK